MPLSDDPHTLLIETLLAVLETGPWFRETAGDYGVYWCCGASAGWMGRPGDPTSDPHDADCPYIKAWALLGADVMVRDMYPEATDAADR